MQPVDRDFLRLLRRLGFAEGISTLVLFGVAMPLKYVWDMPLAVTIVGSLHGALFIALVATLWIAVDRVPIGWKLAIVGAIAAVVPFGPFFVDRRLARVAAGAERRDRAPVSVPVSALGARPRERRPRS